MKYHYSTCHIRRYHEFIGVHVSAKQLPKVTYESYLPLSMDFINVHSFANKYSARAHKNGRLEYSSHPFLCCTSLVCGPTKVLITCNLCTGRA